MALKVQNSVTSALQELITRYLDERKHRSLASLAKAAGVGYTTVRRIAQGEAVANQETTLAIIDVILPAAEKVEFLKEHFPKIGKILEEAYPEDSKAMTPASEVERIFRSQELHNFIFNLASTSKGTTVKEIVHLAGKRGLQALDEMVIHGLLDRDIDGNVTYPEHGWALTNVSEILEQIKYSVRYFDRELVGTDASKLMHATASVNRDAVAKIQDLVSKFTIDLIRLKDQPEMEGDIPIYVDLLMSCYDRDKFLASEKEK